MTVERDRNWYREQIVLLEQEIDRIQAGRVRDGDRSLGRCLADMDTCTKAVTELEARKTSL